ncbi:TPA: PerC family transcriptional regulator [Escherichia coli]|nr:PerC family transcriptional regulator [Escherichia coli]
MIHDSKAEALEARGLYRRAAARWAEVIMLVDTDREREEAAKRRSECIRKSRPPAPPEKLSAAELKEALRRTQKIMGMEDIQKRVWRSYQRS